MVVEIQDSSLLTPKSLTSFLKFKYFPKPLFPNINNLPVFLKITKDGISGPYKESYKNGNYIKKYRNSIAWH